MKLRITIFLPFLLFFHICFSNVNFYSINSIYGISMRENGSVCKDDNGFIWTSSKTGILRVTEGNYRIYQLPYITADIISVYLLYGNGSLMAYTNNGQLFLYDELYDRFNFMVDLRELLNNRFIVIHKIFVDNAGIFWIASSSGLYKYNKSNLLQSTGIQDDVSYAVSFDEDRLVFATNNGMFLFNILTGESKPLISEKNYNIKVSKFYLDKKMNRLWIGTLSSGLYYYDIKDKLLSKVEIKNFPRQPVLAIEENSDSTLLVGIDGQGIWELTKDGKAVLSVYKEDGDNPYSLRGDGVYDIYCDENKRVWVATYSGGLSFYEQESPLVTQITHQINTPNSLGNNNVNKVLEDKRGNIWFATNNGMSRWDRSENRWNTYYQNKQEQAQVFLALCEDDKGNIWAGTYSSGVYVLDGNTGRELMHYSPEEDNADFSGKFIFDIYKDSDGDIWIGGIESDVICYLAKENRFVSYQAQAVRSFRELSPGKILLACTWALLLLDKEKGEYDILLGNYLTQDVLVIDNNIWIGTCGDGLICYNYAGRNSEKYTTENGLISNYLNSIMYSEGYLWLGTENGLCRFNPSDKSVLTYQSIFSLSNLAFNVNSKYRLKDGDMIFGTNSGAILFNPDKLYQSQPLGKIFFQDISISGRSIRENPNLLQHIPVDKQTKLSLKYNQNTLTLEMLPVGISSTGSKFSWKLEGLDTDWSTPSDYPVINYANIPNGNFKLQIRMFDSALSQVIDERTLEIKITPPFWNTWWFYLTISIILAGIVYFVMKVYVDRLEQRHAEDKIRFFTNTAHDIRTSLTLITAPIEEVNKVEDLPEKVHYYLNLASEQSSRLSFVATQLLDFQKVDIGKGQVFLVMTDIVHLVFSRKSMFEATAKKKDVELIFTSNQESFITAIDELKIEKVVDNLISNAIKYSHPNGKVEILLTCNNDKWSLEVKDYGLGISENAKSKLFREFYRGDNVINSKMVGSGIGLLLVKNYVTMHQGEVFLESKENVGSSFKIEIPYKEVEKTNMTITSAGETNIESETTTESELNSESLSLSEKTDDTTERTHILIVEDNNDLQNFLKYSFQEHYKITTADDGVEAWEAINKDAPDLIISDVMMPNMDGFELCRLIKSTHETSHIPVILLTALSEKTQQLEGLGLGAEDYITKPFDMSLLTQRINSIVKNREIIREKALKLSDKNADEPILKNDLNDKFVKKAMEVVMNNISNSEFGKNDFASEMNMSASLLYKKMKAITGQSPTDFQRIARLNHSIELLKSQEYSITEISELCGFSSIGYYSYAFRKQFGKSPSDYLGQNNFQ